MISHKRFFYTSYALVALIVLVGGYFVAGSATEVTADNSGVYSANDSVIVTTKHKVPNFAARPTVISKQSGNWFSASTWDQGRVPGENDVVRVSAGHAIVYNGISNADIAAIGVDGVLTFDTTKNTSMKVGTIFVYGNGKFHVGTELSPIPANIKAEIIIADRPLATSGPDTYTGTYDPHQFGTGLISYGEVIMHGKKINKTWFKLTQEPRAGQNTLTLEAVPTGWAVGDEVVLPDTRQTPLVRVYSKDPNPPVSLQLEEFTIAGISGNTITLTSPLKFDHLGGRDTNGKLISLPHVGNLTRNIVMRSETPNGVRGHTLFGDRARIDIRYASFLDMGRTTADPLDNMKMVDGVITKIGTNQIGRYAVHFDHLMGPKNSSNTGYQFSLIGNSVVRSAKWAVTVHDSHFGLISNNVVYDAQGSGIATEAGNERENNIENNFVVKIGVMKQGRFEPIYGGVGGSDRPLGFGDFGWEGSGLWFFGNDNYVTGNVVANAAYAGIMYNSRPAGFALNAPTVPNFRGADALVTSDWKKYYREIAPKIRISNNNEVYASAVGLWVSFSGEVGTLSNYLMWNIKQKGIYSLRNDSVLYDNITIVSNQSVSNANDISVTNFGLDFGGESYKSGTISVTNSKIEGFNLGLKLPNFLKNSVPTVAPVTPPVTVLNNVYLRNYVNILEGSPRQGQKLTLLKDIQLVQNSGPANKFLSMEPAGILTKLETNWNDRHVTLPSQTYVFNYNKQSGNNFEVFLKEQAPNYVMVLREHPAGSGTPVLNANCPTIGLTNAQCWAEHSVAILNKIATCTDDTTHPEIKGFTCPISSSETFDSVLDKISTTLTPAPVLTFTGTPSTIAVGQVVSLSWKITDATSCTATGAWSGTKSVSGGATTVSPTKTSTYGLSCAGLGGTVVKEITIAVNTTDSAPSKFTFGDRSSVVNGPVNVRETAGLNGILLGSHSTNDMGTIVAGPIIKDGFTWWGIDYDSAPDGWTVEDFLTKSSVLTVPVSTKFSVKDSVTVNTGDSSSLNVRGDANGTLLGQQTNGALGIVISTSKYVAGLSWWNIDFQTGSDGWVVEDFLQKTVITTDPVTSTSTSTTIGDTTTSTTTSTTTEPVVITPTPTLTFTATPSTLTAGEATTLSWKTADSTACEAIGAWSGSKSVPDGSVTFSPTETSTYGLTCTGQGGTVSKEVVIIVNSIKEPVVVKGIVIAQDDFNSAQISGGSGWKSDWVLNPLTDPRYTSGLARFVNNGIDRSYALRVSGSGETKSAARAVDLTGVTNATISFSWNVSNWDKGKNILIEGNDGSGWKTIMEYVGSGDVVDYSFPEDHSFIKETFSIANFEMNSDFKIKISKTGVSGYWDYFHIENLTISGDKESGVTSKTFKHNFASVITALYQLLEKMKAVEN